AAVKRFPSRGLVLQFQDVKPKLRVWIVFHEGLKLGDGRARLLRLIDERGSLRQAATALGMSYRNAWGYLRDLERAAGFAFVERSPHGRARSGMRLTAEARAFLARYGRFQRRLETAATREFAREFARMGPGTGHRRAPRAGA